MLVIECHVEGVWYRPEPVEPVRVARHHDRRVRTPHHLARRHRPLAPHSVHNPDPARGAPLAPHVRITTTLSHAAENPHSGLPVEALTPQHALAKDLVELCCDTVHLRRTGVTAAAHALDAGLSEEHGGAAIALHAHVHVKVAVCSVQALVGSTQLYAQRVWRWLGKRVPQRPAQGGVAPVPERGPQGDDPSLTARRLYEPQLVK
eukprot:scaffold118341_cov63-Phaeocystis_antarctica.AAC.2